MDKTEIKYIRKRLASLYGSTVNATTQEDCGLYIIQAINFMSSAVQYLANRGLIPNVTLLHEINMG